MALVFDRVQALTLADLSPVDVVDLLLVATARHRVAGVALSPKDHERHELVLEHGVWVTTLSLPVALGDAVVARLAILAELDVAGTEPQLGRLRVRVGEACCEVMVAVRPAAHGLAAEVRRLADAADPDIAGPAGPRGSIGGYRILDELGKGGMGIVYRAEHIALGKEVAIKVLCPEVGSVPQAAARFAREGRTASRIRHPGIVDVTDYGTLPDGRAFLVMELVRGRTLAMLLAQRGPLPPARATEVARQIAAALQAAHDAGVVHRDLKPANVFVDDQDRVKICDFGVAKVVGQPPGPAETQQGVVLGTPHYMSPEQVRGASTDARTDLYSLGCMLFEMLSGRVPYDAQNAMDVMLLQLGAPLPSVTNPRGPMPDLLERILARAMAKRVEERYQTAREMAADLDRASALLARGGWRTWLPA
jgi:eukaryotic-like serine/threonine-protein kinase